MHFYLTDTSASFIAEGLAAIAASTLPGSNLSLTVSTNLPNVSLSLQGTGRQLIEKQELKAFIEKTKERRYVTCQTASLASTQNNSPPTVSINFNRQQTTAVTLNQSSDETLSFRLADAIHEHLGGNSLAATIRSQLPPAEQEQLRFRDSVVRELESQVAKIGSFVLEQAKRNSEFIDTTTKQLNDEYRKKEYELETRIKKNQDTLDTERQAFEETRRNFDDRERTHVRRALLEKLNEIIANHKSASAISNNTEARRRLIHAICATALIASGTLMGFFAKRIAGDPTFSLNTYFPFLSGTLIFASTLIYYLRWNDQWLKELAQFELSAKKLEADVTRASWVAELFFEYKDERGASLPIELLQSLTRDLFVQSSHKNGPVHPLDDIVHLINKAQHLRVNGDGFEISKRPPK